MANVSLILRIAKFSLAVSLIALSAALFFLTGHAFKEVATDYPDSVNDSSRYAWSNNLQDYLNHKYHYVWLHYDWSNENFMWVVGGGCIIAGFLSLFDAIMQQLRARKGHPSKSGVFTFITLGFSGVALLVTFITMIYVPANNASKRKSTCNVEVGRKENASLMCTREIVVCEIPDRLATRSWGIVEQSCKELKATRLMTIPMTILAALLVATYVVQIRSARSKDLQQPSADERVARLQGDE